MIAQLKRISLWMLFISLCSMTQIASSFHLAAWHTSPSFPSMRSSPSYMTHLALSRQQKHGRGRGQKRSSQHRTLVYSSNSNQDPKNYEYYRPQSRGAPNGGEMAYVEENVRRSAETFQSIRKIGGVQCTNDVYARGTNRFEFWYVGKIARTTGTITLQQGISRIWNLIEEHACRLRPVELGREYGSLEIWCSKTGDTELSLSQATATGNPKEDDAWSLMKMERNVLESGSKEVSALEVGFIAEVVTNQGQGFYIVRDNEGNLLQ